MFGPGIRRSGARGHRAKPWLAALVLAVLLAAAACSSPRPQAHPAPPTAPASRGTPTGDASGGPAVNPPDTPAGAQLRWLMTAAGHPLSDAQVRAHFDAAYLDQFSPPVLNQMLQAVTSLRLLSIRVSQPSTVVASIAAGNAQGQVWLTVDGQGLISWLRISPATAGPTPASWAGVDGILHLVAPQVRLLVADVSDGSCQPVHSIDPGTPAPLGSAFKLYVLDALASAVAAGKVRWDQPLTVTAQVKGLPPGELQIAPDSTQVSVQDTAAKMISISDNTAADMLIDLVGRSAVEAALTATGMTSPAMNRPFLTTREIFVLKLHQWPSLARRYIAADEPSRRALLSSIVDRAPLPTVASAGSWTTPRDIDQLEYFASASDICRAYASLADLARRPGLAPVTQMLSVNDDGLQLDPATWQTTWFKGGSEPGVLTLAYLATTRTGKSYVVTVLAEDPSRPLDEALAIPAILSAVKGAFTLAARG
jgi:beta-lactamase class A